MSKRLPKGDYLFAEDFLTYTVMSINLQANIVRLVAKEGKGMISIPLEEFSNKFEEVKTNV